MSAILKAAEKYRIQLHSLDDDALKLIERTYARTLDRLQDKLVALTEKIGASLASGEIPAKDHPFWLIRQARYHELMSQIEDEIGRLSGWSSGLVADQQKRAALLGIDHSLGLLRQSVGVIPAELARDGYALTWNKVDVDALENLVGFLKDGSPLDYKFAGMPDQIKDSVKETILSEMAQGRSPVDMTLAVNRSAMGFMSNVQAVCRTETMRAYRTASGENYQANDDVVKGWIWSCAHQSTTCAACWGKDGSFHSLGETLDDHVCGRCVMLPVTKTWAELFPDRDLSHVRETGVTPWNPKTYFRQLSADEQLFVLGRTKYAMWRRGEIQLEDIPSLRTSPVWGNSYVVGNLSEVAARAQARI